jgi:hypothetical protein
MKSTFYERQQAPTLGPLAQARGFSSTVVYIVPTKY